MNSLPTNSSSSSGSNFPHPAAGFANRFGLHPAIALFTLCLDGMLWGAETVTLGMSLPLSLLASGAVGYVTYHGQQVWFGDSPQSAKTKAVLLATLTFLPTSIPCAAYLPAGVLGLFKKRD